MKKLLLILVMLPFVSLAKNLTQEFIRTNLDSIDITSDGSRYAKMFDEADIAFSATFRTVNVGSIRPTRNIIITGNDKKLILDFSSDTLIVTGDMEMDEAAKKFIDYCKQVYQYKLDSLENIIKKLKQTIKYTSSASVDYNFIKNNDILISVNDNGTLIGEKMKPLDEQYLDWCNAESNKITVGYRFILQESDVNSLFGGTYYEVCDKKYDEYTNYLKYYKVDFNDPETVYYYWEKQLKNENPQYFKPQKYIRAEPIKRKIEPTFEGFVKWKKKYNKTN